jgi:hypothetical protein
MSAMVGKTERCHHRFCCIQVVMNVQFYQGPVVEPCPPYRMFVDAKTQWLDEMQSATGRRT